MNSEKQYTNLQMTLREVNRVGEGQKNVPKLRFKGYEDAWEQRKLGEIVLSEIKGSAKAEMIGGDTPYLETNYLNGGECLFVDSENNVDTDDVIVLWDGSQAGTVYHGFSGALGSTFKAYKTKCLGLFIFQQLKKNQQTIYDKYRTPNIPHVIKTFKDEYDVMLTSEEEQNEIGRYFQQIDHLITLHQRKYDALKSMKKTLLSKMFPKNGEDVPEIRFKEFTDAWEQRKLGEVCERVVRKNKNYESDLPLTIASQFGLIDQRDFFRKIVAAKDMSNYYLLKKGEFAYNKSYSKGFDFGSIKRLNNYELGCLSTLYICFQIASNRVESDYLEVYFDTLNWYKDVMSICAEGARNHGLLNVDTKAFFEEVNVDIPREILEQKNIASSLEKVEKLITLHQRKLEELKNMKKTLLQQMFV